MSNWLIRGAAITTEACGSLAKMEPRASSILVSIFQQALEQM